jgi:hypothetical protein
LGCVKKRVARSKHDDFRLMMWFGRRYSQVKFAEW